MKHLVVVLTIALVMIALTGCKLPQSVLDGTGLMATKGEKVKEVVMPLIDFGITTYEGYVAKAEKPEDKAKYQKILDGLIEAKKDLPRIVRNIKQLHNTLLAFNGLATVFEEEAKKPEEPKPIPVSPTP